MQEAIAQHERPRDDRPYRSGRSWHLAGPLVRQRCDREDAIRTSAPGSIFVRRERICSLDGSPVVSVAPVAWGVSIEPRAIMGDVRPRVFSDRPLTARDCADYMGFTPAWIRKAITEGVQVRGTTVRLAAETLEVNGRRTYRVYEHSFSTFLRAIGWSHLPHVAAANEQETTT